MTQNDQAAMNEQLTELRLNGLSIDGDNRYKQDLIDAVIGAMMFGAQGANPPPAGHWLEQFYVIAREERQALARVEAEAGRLAEAGLAAHVKATAAQAQLAEMRRIVAGFLFNYDDGVGKPWERRLLDYARKLVDAKEFNAQTEQQEAQGEQAGDLASAVRVLLEVPQLQGEQAFSAQPIIDRVRAALATQPAKQITRMPIHATKVLQLWESNRRCCNVGNALRFARAIEAESQSAVRGAEHE